MDDKLQKVIQRCKTDLPYYAENFIKIVDKSGKLVPFVMNEHQLMVNEKIEQQLKEEGRVRVIILKSRRLGLSTFVAARFMQKTLLSTNKRAGVITHLGDSTQALFTVYKRMHKHLPDFMQPPLEKSNAKELIFGEIDSSIKVATATSEGGRGDTLHFGHLSECAFWVSASDTMASYVQSISETDDSEIIIESTSNGIGNVFHTMWCEAEKGNNGFLPIFLPWSSDSSCVLKVRDGFELTEDEKEYQALYGLSLEQMAWRRSKISQMGADKFQQEYPISVAEAFRSTTGNEYIPSNLVVAARKRKLPPESDRHPLVLGVDVAAMGKDKSCFAWRRGNSLLKYELHGQKTNEELTDMLANIIIKDKPAKIFVDGTGGYGGAVVSLLRLRGYECTAINFASTPTDQSYGNKRAEMYGELKLWLGGEVSLPDDDSIESDLTSFGYFHNVQGRLLIEAKKDIRKRLGRSPDIGDALALTFAQRLGQNLDNLGGAWDQIVNRQAVYDW